MGKRRLSLILAGCIFLGGCTLFAYPSISQWWNNRHQSEVVADYAEAVNELTDEEANQEIDRAKDYNLNLSNAVDDPFQNPEETTNPDYDTLLNFTADGVMAYIEIPSIDVLLPIYHGASNSVLAKGIGHLPETSLPVGGPSTHCVLAGHSGMSHARLFTDITKLEIGDSFAIHVYNKTMNYTVDQIKTVLPTDTTDLSIIPNEDHITLITCVPVGVNSHRLLVRGTRTE